VQLSHFSHSDISQIIHVIGLVIEVSYLSSTITTEILEFYNKEIQ